MTVRGQLVLVAMCLLVSGCHSTEEPLPDLGAIPSFDLTDQDGAPFRATDLDGHVTVATFIFTRCPSICPMLVERGVAVQERMEPWGDRAKLVSFTVDPEHDTPEVLRAFGDARGADFNRWSFVTGDIDDVNRVVVHGFKLAMGEPTPTEDGRIEIMHSSHFVLLDPHRHIRGYYASRSEGIDDLMHDVERLLPN